MYKPSMVDSPSGGAPAKAPSWDLADTVGYGGGNCFSLAPRMFSGYVGGRLWGPGDRGARPPLQGAPTISWAPRAATNVLLPPIYTHVPRKHPGSQ